ncbi:hypothetical protein BCR32DRAFT_293832 [Anaeromyces robustus]|uniref:C2H2-type domain-containing protein n=1 Tax=Anaeromyces robustus TaxID=1754192 RepID=A0A1Y1X3R4_9FUNG|nr:hypothetical protein BCR32DRAFT_293832 [Anaeromyces robustus]|eukprot:ORX80433.1 hypothetical protein BCR32DRAFT_293832 [Anaeromyces robustus]
MSTIENSNNYKALNSNLPSPPYYYSKPLVDTKYIDQNEFINMNSLVYDPNLNLGSKDNIKSQTTTTSNTNLYIDNKININNVNVINSPVESATTRNQKFIVEPNSMNNYPIIKEQMNSPFNNNVLPVRPYPSPCINYNNGMNDNKFPSIINENMNITSAVNEPSPNTIMVISNDYVNLNTSSNQNTTNSTYLRGFIPSVPSIESNAVINSNTNSTIISTYSIPNIINTTPNTAPIATPITTPITTPIVKSHSSFGTSQNPLNYSTSSYVNETVVQSPVSYLNDYPYTENKFLPLNTTFPSPSTNLPMTPLPSSSFTTINYHPNPIQPLFFAPNNVTSPVNSHSSFASSSSSSSTTTATTNVNNSNAINNPSTPIASSSPTDMNSHSNLYGNKNGKNKLSIIIPSSNNTTVSPSPVVINSMGPILLTPTNEKNPMVPSIYKNNALEFNSNIIKNNNIDTPNGLSETTLIKSEPINELPMKESNSDSLMHCYLNDNAFSDIDTNMYFTEGIPNLAITNDSIPSPTSPSVNTTNTSYNYPCNKIIKQNTSLYTSFFDNITSTTTSTTTTLNTIFSNPSVQEENSIFSSYKSNNNNININNNNNNLNNITKKSQQLNSNTPICISLKAISKEVTESLPTTQSQNKSKENNNNNNNNYKGIKKNSFKINFIDMSNNNKNDKFDYMKNPNINVFTSKLFVNVNKKQEKIEKSKKRERKLGKSEKSKTGKKLKKEEIKQYEQILNFENEENSEKKETKQKQIKKLEKKGTKQHEQKGNFEKEEKYKKGEIKQQKSIKISEEKEETKQQEQKGNFEKEGKSKEGEIKQQKSIKIFEEKEETKQQEQNENFEEKKETKQQEQKGNFEEKEIKIEQIKKSEKMEIQPQVKTSEKIEIKQEQIKKSKKVEIEKYNKSSNKPNKELDIKFDINDQIKIRKCRYVTDLNKKSNIKESNTINNKINASIEKFKDDTVAILKDIKNTNIENNIKNNSKEIININDFIISVHNKIKTNIDEKSAQNHKRSNKVSLRKNNKNILPSMKLENIIKKTNDNISSSKSNYNENHFDTNNNNNNNIKASNESNEIKINEKIINGEEKKVKNVKNKKMSDNTKVLKTCKNKKEINNNKKVEVIEIDSGKIRNDDDIEIIEINSGKINNNKDIKLIEINSKEINNDDVEVVEIIHKKEDNKKENNVKEIKKNNFTINIVAKTMNGKRDGKVKTLRKTKKPKSKKEKHFQLDDTVTISDDESMVLDPVQPIKVKRNREEEDIIENNENTSKRKIKKRKITNNKEKVKDKKKQNKDKNEKEEKKSGKKSTSLQKINKSTRTKRNNRPYDPECECDICKKTFSRKYDLIRHRRIHTGENPYKCEICGLGFTRSDHRDRHVRRSPCGETEYYKEVMKKAQEEKAKKLERRKKKEEERRRKERSRKINNIVKGYKSSNNSISNIDILGSKKIVNRYRIYIFLIGGRDYGFSDRINNSPYKKEWECLFKCQTESGTYSKSPFLLRSAALLNDIMPVVCKRQHILFNKFKTNLSRNVNADNTVGQPSRANADPISDPSGIG